MPDVSAVVVTHGSPAEAIACVASLRRAFDAENIAGQIVLVDTGSGAASVRRLETAGADLFLPLADNRGYAGGVNAGLARATSFRIILSNADVVFRPGSISPLLEVIAEPRVGAIAPIAFWDSRDRLRLPAGWASGFRSDLAQLSAGRDPSRDRRRFAAAAREAVRLWQNGGPARHLSGAVLAVRRDVFDRAGRFDERFPFEYEETEWEDRVTECGLSLRVVTAARVRHLWGPSAVEGGDRARRRARSRRLYWGRRYGRIGRALLERAARHPSRELPPAIPKPRVPAREGAWVAVSTNPSVLPFAGAPLDVDFELPSDVEERLPAVPVYLRSFRASDGEALETFVWSKEGS